MINVKINSYLPILVSILASKLDIKIARLITVNYAIYILDKFYTP